MELRNIVGKEIIERNMMLEEVLSKYDPALDLTLNTHNLVSNYEWKSSNWSFDLGLFSQFQDNYSNPNTGIRRLIPDYVRTEIRNLFYCVLFHLNFLDLGFWISF